jgi:hypothetical protein
LVRSPRDTLVYNDRLRWDPSRLPPALWRRKDHGNELQPTTIDHSAGLDVSTRVRRVCLLFAGYRAYYYYGFEISSPLP